MRSRPYTTDTLPDVYAKQLELLRAMPPMQRMERAAALSGQVKQMSFDAIRRHHPDWDDETVRLKFIEVTYGRALADDVRRHLGERSGERDA
ncbi:MAG: hypothetical protein R3C10_20330 [Pirellulales bacterium]|nr:hypothetical protein [Planctomycetales bacterium]